MENNMKIFDQEMNDGLEKVIASNSRISYASVAEPCFDKGLSKIKNIKSLAALNDNDLYYVQSILVSSNWNKNDDIFDKGEVWLARNTPEDKPTNLEHDEATIIGHITSNWPIAEDGSLIDEGTSLQDLPNKYHILTGSVIYRAFSNPDLKDRAEKLIAEIENGQKYVSMECLFNGFDYGLVNASTGEYKVLARNDNTAYLTKHLRAYGGSGEHEGYKVGRVLRNITFSGKGFVDKPANPDSIIFTKKALNSEIQNNFEQKNEDLSIAGVSNDQLTPNAENNIMSLDIEVVIKDVAEIKNKIEAMEVKAAEVASQTIATLQNKNDELAVIISASEARIAELTSALEVASLEKEEAAKKKTEEDSVKEEEMKKAKSEIEAANEVIAGYKKQEEEMAKKEKKMKRMASLIEAGLSNDAASSAADTFDSLNDESFDAMTTLLAGKMPPWLKDKDEETKEEDKSEKKKASEVVDANVLESAEVDNSVNLSVGGQEESTIEATRAALVEFVSSRLGKKL
jgi:hypothetical protein